MYRDTNQREFARALRNQPTDAEIRLRHFLRAQNLRGRKFRRQAAIGAYIVDFVCFTDKLIVELDGPQHLDPEAVEPRQAAHDLTRCAWLPHPPLPKPRTKREFPRGRGRDRTGD
jgi:very-short-patch-repair endonuclease